jgi:two-component system, NarL family, sensor histidine kinase UhpB
MFSHIFDVGYYTTSLYVQPVLIVGTLLGALGIIVLVKERGSPVGSTFAFMTSSAALWLLASAAIYSTSFESVAQVWTKVQMVGVVLIPSSVYIFTLTITQRLHQFRIWAWGSVALSVLFYLSIILTDEFITGVRRSFWGYSPQYGLLSIPFLVFFFASMLVSLRLYWVGYRNSPPQSIQQKRFRALFFAFVVAYLASVDYLEAFGIPIYPVGYLLGFFWFLIVAFAIRRYHLFDITPSFAANHILAMMADALLVLDCQGVVRVVNRAACELLGKGEADLVGMPITTISSQFFTPQQTESLISNGDVYNYEISLATEQDDVRVLSVSASWIRDHTNQPVGMIYIAQDITERKRTEDQVRTLNMELEQRVMERTAQLQDAVNELQGYIAERNRIEGERARLTVAIEQERATLAAVMASMSDGLLVLDAAHRVHYCNTRVGEFLGINPTLAIGQPIEQVIAETRQSMLDPDAANSRWENLLTDPHRLPSIEVTTNGSSQRNLLVSAFPVTDTIQESLGLLLKDMTIAKALALLEERERIAMDIHDGVIQSLYAVALSLSAHERLLAAEAEETRQALQRARVQISNIIQEIRDVIFDLRQHRRQLPDLQTGLKTLVAELFGHTLIHVDLELEDGTDRFLDPVRVSSILYIACEAMSNVIRHAGASEVMIHLARMEEKLVLTIRDNGRGFNPVATDVESSGPTEGQGLRNMAERAQLLGGRLLVVSSPGHGTEVYVEVRV